MKNEFRKEVALGIEAYVGALPAPGRFGAGKRLLKARPTTLIPEQRRRVGVGRERPEKNFGFDVTNLGRRLLIDIISQKKQK